MSLDIKSALEYLFNQGQQAQTPKAPAVTKVETGHNEVTHYVTRQDGVIDVYKQTIENDLNVTTKSIEDFVGYLAQAAAQASDSAQRRYITVDAWGRATVLLSGGDKPERKITYEAPFTRQFQALYDFVEAGHGKPLHEAAHKPKSYYEFVMEYAANVEASSELMTLLQSITITSRTKVDLSDSFFGVAGANYSVTVSNGSTDQKLVLPRGFEWRGSVLSDPGLVDQQVIEVSTTPNVIGEALIFGCSFEDLIATRLGVCARVKKYLNEHVDAEDGFAILID